MHGESTSVLGVIEGRTHFGRVMALPGLPWCWLWPYALYEERGQVPTKLNPLKVVKVPQVDELLEPVEGKEKRPRKSIKNGAYTRMSLRPKWCTGKKNMWLGIR